MADTTKIVDRGGRRVRTYHPVNPDRPGQQMRRRMAAEGKRWCRSCRDWREASEISKNGLCRPHENADAAERYARPGRYREHRQERSAIRARNVAAMPALGAALLTELFGGLCAYCPAPATCWDHAHPVALGGATTPGNMLPACKPCNSAKRDMPLETWLDRVPETKAVTIDYLSHRGTI